MAYKRKSETIDDIVAPTVLSDSAEVNRIVDVVPISKKARVSNEPGTSKSKKDKVSAAKTWQEVQLEGEDEVCHPVL
jgi:hypothetical protein